MRQDIVSMYGDSRRKVMQAVDKIEATCVESPFSTKRFPSTKECGLCLGVKSAGREGLDGECDR
jgi:hypothetical protein